MVSVPTSDDVVIRVSGVSKMYKIFASPGENFVDAIGLGWVLPWVGVRVREFWALREIDLDLKRGSRVGVIGRNGAGKSTLLKLVTGNLAPTEGHVEVNGRVQALIDAGVGFHPEFTGRENIHASLTYQDLRRDEIIEVTREIAEFSELADFLDQPYKTYSLGMQARLAFATATAIKPQILIVDEMLGAGDAYFLSKSNGRILQLVSGGTSLLLVSHSLDHITLLCNETLWLDCGRVVMRGASMEVVKAYEKHIRVLEDRRLKAKNRQVQRLHAGAMEDEDLRETAAPPALSVEARANAAEGSISESRWPGEGSLLVDEVRLMGVDGREQAVFEVRTPMTLRVWWVARKPGSFKVIPVAVLYRIDGVRVSSHVGKQVSVELAAGERRSFSLRYDSVNLGNGRFIFSVALYRVLDPLVPAELYDLLDRSYEFQVVGNRPLEDGVFRHPGEWCLD